MNPFKKELTKNKNSGKYLPLLCMLYISASSSTFILAYKMSYIHGILISTGIFVFPFTYFFAAVVADVYKYEFGKRLVYHGFICQAFFALSIYLLVKLPPPPNWHYQSQYTFVLEPVFWFFISNATGVFIGSFLNVYILSKWKDLVKGKYFIIRCITSSFIGEAITSLIADIMAFSKHMPTADLGKLILAIYSIKMIYSILLAYPAKFLCNKLKKIENIQESYSPINLFPGVTRHG